MAELVDALVSGTSLRKVMGVRVPLWAKKNKNSYLHSVAEKPHLKRSIAV